jgi:hypothetical protein
VYGGLRAIFGFVDSFSLPKAIERAFDIGASDIREVINNRDGRDTRSPAQLTDDLADLDHRY